MSRFVTITSGRRRRPLVVLLAYLAVAMLPSTGAAQSRAAAVTVKPSQQLVALLFTHQIRSAPSLRAASLGLVPARTPITDARTVLPVLAQDGQWLKVRLPGRPNGHTGWIRRSATVASVTYWHVVVDPAHRLVTAYWGGRSVGAFRAVVGKPSTPTPAGEFFVEETIALDASDAGAPYALALSARSNVLQEFGGGPGQIALHGLAHIGGVPGTAASHGCIRLYDGALRWLIARIGPGVPVTIRR